jgi:hypothetical protein
MHSGTHGYIVFNDNGTSFGKQHCAGVNFYVFPYRYPGSTDRIRKWTHLGIFAEMFKFPPANPPHG